jgi:hypothetical protein
MRLTAVIGDLAAKEYGEGSTIYSPGRENDSAGRGWIPARAVENLET